MPETATVPEPAARNNAAIAHDTARWIALRATVIVMPVFVLALSRNPSAYIAAIMKTVALGRPAGDTDSRYRRPRTRRLDLHGRDRRACTVARTVDVAEPVDADPVADGRRPVDRRRDDQRAARAAGRHSGAMRWSPP